MFEAGEGVFDVAGHGEFDGSFAGLTRYIPVESNVTEDVALPIYYGLVLLFEVMDEVDTVLAMGVFNIEVINNEDKFDGSCAVLE